MMTLFALGAVLWFSSGAAILVGTRFSTVGQSRRSVKVLLFAFPYSSLGAVMMVPGVFLIGEDSIFQNVLLIALLALWAVFGLICTNTCLHLLLFASDKPNTRPFFSRRPS